MKEKQKSPEDKPKNVVNAANSSSNKFPANLSKLASGIKRKNEDFLKELSDKRISIVESYPKMKLEE